MKMPNFLRMMKNNAKFWSFWGSDILVIHSTLIVLSSSFQNHVGYNLIKLCLQMELKCRLSALWWILFSKKEEMYMCFIGLHLCCRLYHLNEIFMTGFLTFNSTKRKAFPLAVLPKREFVSENIWFLQVALLAVTNTRFLKHLVVCQNTKRTENRGLKNYCL